MLRWCEELMTRLAFSRIDAKVGSSIAVRTPVMASTTSISRRLKPWRRTDRLVLSRSDLVFTH